ncbi:MAG: hypothetical protein S4CHLAM2_13360 [Chlamydiales bacterium]|nr:hypothetical protein [Chlamydiales bacterium]
MLFFLQLLIHRARDQATEEICLPTIPGKFWVDADGGTWIKGVAFAQFIGLIIDQHLKRAGSKKLICFKDPLVRFLVLQLDPLLPAQIRNALSSKKNRRGKILLCLNDNSGFRGFFTAHNSRISFKFKFDNRNLCFFLIFIKTSGKILDQFLKIKDPPCTSLFRPFFLFKNWILI